MRVVSILSSVVVLAACSFSGTPGEAPDDNVVPSADAGADVMIVIEDCGNGALDPGEGCDDGATAIGDGCDDQCQIEPGYECATSGCVEVDDVSWVGTPTDTPNSVGDSTGGSGFQLDCQPGEVAIGFTGIHGTDCGGAGGGVARLRVRCAAIDFDAAGASTPTNVDDVGPEGVCNPAGTISNGTIDCAAGTVLVGIRGNPDQYMRRLEGVCQPLSHVGGAMVLGDDELASGTLGPVPAMTVAVNCPAGHVVAGVNGNRGQVIDRLHLACVTLDVN